ncbi:MAG: nitrogenase-stabilizing/protective protein NifW [Colwellia sp.]
MNLAEQLEELDSAESFLNLFKVDFDPDIIMHRRIELLRLFHKNLTAYQEPLQWNEYQQALSQAYCLLKRGEKMALAGSACGSCDQC